MNILWQFAFEIDNQESSQLWNQGLEGEIVFLMREYGRYCCIGRQRDEYRHGIPGDKFIVIYTKDSPMYRSRFSSARQRFGAGGASHGSVSGGAASTALSNPEPDPVHWRRAVFEEEASEYLHEEVFKQQSFPEPSKIKEEKKKRRMETSWFGRGNPVCKYCEN